MARRDFCLFLLKKYFYLLAYLLTYLLTYLRVPILVLKAVKEFHGHIVKQMNGCCIN